jgi:hypothetical protein
VLPRLRKQSPNSKAATDYGTLVHYWKETGDSHPSWAASGDIALLEKKLVATDIDRDDWWPPERGRHEITAALNLRTREIQVYRGARDGADEWKRQFGPEWLTGTVDWVGVTKDGLPWIDDLKTGRWPVDPRTKQLLSYGLVDYGLGGWRPSYQAERSITQWPKYPIAALPERKWGPLMTALELEEHLDDLRWALDHPTEMNPGPEQCRFCDSQGACPAYAETLA